MAESVTTIDSGYATMGINTSSLQYSLEEFDLSHQENGSMLNNPIVNVEEMVMPTQEEFNMEIRDGQALTSTDPEKLLEERLNKTINQSINQTKYETKRLCRTF